MSRISHTVPASSILPVEVLEQSGAGGAWEFRQTSIEEILDSAKVTPTFVFADISETWLHDPGALDLRRRVEDYYGMPTNTWSSSQLESNGYFGCAGDEHVRHKTWFRFVVKFVIQEMEDGGGYRNDLWGLRKYQYYWYKMGFFSTWSPSGTQSILCLDCLPELKTRIRKYLATVDQGRFRVDPYCFHACIVSAVVSIFDSSIWALRDITRLAEMPGRGTSGAMQHRNLEFLHGVSNHVIHFTENLTVASEIISKMLRRHGSFVSRAGSLPEKDKESIMQVDTDLDYSASLLYGFKCRCEGMQRRHEGQVAWAQFRAVAADSAANLQASKAMEKIATITMIFLPATFVSAIFSMSFFDQGADWGLSSKFWIYWAVAIPVTILAMGIMGAWSYKRRYNTHMS